MKKIFLSYRRNDSADVAGRIAHSLQTEFGRECLFRDIDSIPLGEAFPDVIQRALDECSVVLAIIGDRWLTDVDEEGNLRLTNPNDFVRTELITAFNKKKIVIPVLVRGAKIPQRNQLPEDLQALSHMNAALVRPDPDFMHDMTRLCAHLSSKGGLQSRKRKTVVGLFAALLAFAVALAGIGYGLGLLDPGLKAVETKEKSESSQVVKTDTPEAMSSPEPRAPDPAPVIPPSVTPIVPAPTPVVHLPEPDPEPEPTKITKIEVIPPQEVPPMPIQKPSPEELLNKQLSSARIAYASNELEEAAQISFQILAQDSTIGDAWYFWGLSRSLKEGKHLTAIDELNYAIEYGTSYSEVHLHLARLYTEGQSTPHMNKAVWHFNKYVELEPNCSQAIRQEAADYMNRQGMESDARRILQRY